MRHMALILNDLGDWLRLALQWLAAHHPRYPQ